MNWVGVKVYSLPDVDDWNTFVSCLSKRKPIFIATSLGQATLLNSYLVQLLDNGFLHADPHPGNFLLQRDGTLCVLDFGLMTEVSRVRLVVRIAKPSARFELTGSSGTAAECVPLALMLFVETFADRVCLG